MTARRITPASDVAAVRALCGGLWRRFGLRSTRGAVPKGLSHAR